jgi:calpain, invertebrate
MALYKTGEIPRKGYADPKDVEFIYADELCEPKGLIAQFVDDGVASDDCKQGNLLVGGRRGMEYDKDMIVDKEIASLLSNGVYPPIFHKFRSIGLYVIRIFINFTWVYILVDERIPCDTHTRKPVFGRCRNINELWVSLIEKAFAKTYGCYENLISGYVDEGIQELTGMQPEKIFLKDDASGVFPHKVI